MSVMRRQDIKYLGLEAVVVIFGVLTALLVERVREDQARRSAADVAVERLYEEVGRNLAEMQELETVVRERLGHLRQLRDEGVRGSLADLVGRFTGYRTPELSAAAWNRLSGGGLADVVDPELMAEAFYLYEWNEQFAQLDREVNRLIYSELFYVPERRETAIAISERIMEQQLSWAALAIPEYEAFLARTPR